MKLKQLFTDDDAVSPVIGVILMVAITVILAAVIASFVLGLGQDTGNEGPTASFGFDYDAGDDLGASFTEDGVLSVSHQSGDTIESSNLYIRGDGFDAGSGNEWHNVDQSGSGYLANSEISGGASIEFEVTNDYEVSVVWEAAEGDSSKELASNSGPEA